MVCVWWIVWCGDYGVIVMTIEHNVVVVGGMDYKAVDGNSCDGCALVNTTACTRVSCTDDARADGKSVIFKRHYRPTHRELQK